MLIGRVFLVILTLIVLCKTQSDKLKELLRLEAHDLISENTNNFQNYINVKNRDYGAILLYGLDQDCPTCDEARRALSVFASSYYQSSEFKEKPVFFFYFSPTEPVDSYIFYNFRTVPHILYIKPSAKKPKPEKKIEFEMSSFMTSEGPKMLLNWINKEAEINLTPKYTLSQRLRMLGSTVIAIICIGSLALTLLVGLLFGGWKKRWFWQINITIVFFICLTGIVYNAINHPTTFSEGRIFSDSIRTQTVSEGYVAAGIITLCGLSFFGVSYAFRPTVEDLKKTHHNTRAILKAKAENNKAKVLSAERSFNRIPYSVANILIALILLLIAVHMFNFIGMRKRIFKTPVSPLYFLGNKLKPLLSGFADVIPNAENDL